MKGGIILRTLFQLNPEKNECLLISAMLSLCFLSQMRFKIKDFAELVIGISDGSSRFSYQFITFWHTSRGSSSQKGGYPNKHSYIMTPTLHKSTE